MFVCVVVLKLKTHKTTLPYSKTDGQEQTQTRMRKGEGEDEDKKT